MTEHLSDDILRHQLAARASLRQAHKLRRLGRRGLPLGVVRIARTLNAMTGRSFPARARTFWGERMAVRLPEALSCELFGYGYFEQGLSAFVLSEVSPGSTFYDVGAHFGYFTRLAARLVGPTGEVHSFEPTPSSFQLLRANTVGLRQVKLNQSAVWHEPGEVRLHDFGPALSMFNSLFSPRLPDEASSHVRQRDHLVPAVALDDYAADKGVPQFVKIDAESAEQQVLRGMSVMLERHRPTLTLEVGDFGVEGAPSSRSLLESVVERGYRPFEFHEGEIRPHQLRAEYGYDNILLKAV